MNLFVVSLSALALSLCIGVGIGHAQQRFAPSADGQEITDHKTGLIWLRCAEGMTWKARSCTGKPFFSNQADAASRAKSTAAADGKPWRLPTMKELSGLVNMREADENKAAIDPAAFPATPVARFWTSTSAGTGYFMFVGFVEGSAGEGARNSPGAVRLVRDAK
ncbi:MAG TPA: DUF1566 domain-containing protein [Polaromonas sp.]|uniref:Lcl C-terminal domain-containing protein n=1 Tax=Polaromonas sp. TaxID=1869339 RepID=UPI002D4B6EE3|nr:DUF1566 domain-containing protein [Polaromonas sp.]HYW58006.1 DUF1566 domain-containing protein [Polaromonas sp.]